MRSNIGTGVLGSGNGSLMGVGGIGVPGVNVWSVSGGVGGMGVGGVNVLFRSGGVGGGVGVAVGVAVESSTARARALTISPHSSE